MLQQCECGKTFDGKLTVKPNKCDGCGLKSYQNKKDHDEVYHHLKKIKGDRMSSTHNKGMIK